MMTDCTCVAVFSDDDQSEMPGMSLRKASGFAGAAGRTLMVWHEAGPVLLVGMGSRNEATTAVLREAAAAAGRVLSHVDSVKWDLGNLQVPGIPAAAVAQCLAEGASLGSYAYGERLRGLGLSPSWHVPDGSPPGSWELGDEVAQATNFVRDLVNQPANFLTPAALAAHCRRIAGEYGLQVRVLNERDIVDGGLGGVFAVGRGSVERPCLVELGYDGHQGKPDLSLVGKGVTFDSGGLSLKSADGLMTMKQDMAGAASVLGAMMLVRRLAPGLRVKAFLPLVENLPGPDAVRPGDVVTMRNGATVEVLNTDFEGRLILADALALAAEDEPRRLVDLATLTYAAVHALGDRTAALFSNSRSLESAVIAAAERSGEPVWPMPMPAYLEGQLRSHVADYKNFPGSPHARSLTAAMFLNAFVPFGVEWAHLDIAGPAWAESPYGLTPAGATGYGVRLLAELLKDLAQARS